MPLRSLNRKKEKEPPQPKEHKIKPCPSSATLTSAPSLTQTASYYSCTSSLASSTQTRQSVEPPGWVHNPPPRSTLDEENAAANHRLFKENNVPIMRSSCQYPPSNIPRRQWAQDGVPSPVRVVRSPQPPRSQHMSPYQRQNITHMLSDNNTIQMNYSESSSGSSEGSSIISASGDDTFGPILGLNRQSNDDKQLDFEKLECTEEMVQQMNKKMKSKNWTINFELCDDGGDEGQSLRNVPSTMSSKSVDIENQVSFLQAHLREQCENIPMNASEQRSKLEEDSYFPNDLFSPPAAAESGVESPFPSPPQTPSVAADDDGNNTSCSPEEEVGNHTATAALLDMERVKDIYASMMLEFRKKILSELREEMKKETQNQLSAIKLELSEMNNRLAILEKNQTSSHNLQQELHERSSATIETSILKKVTTQVINDKAKQQQQLEDMLDAKLAMAMAGASVELNLAVQEVKKEGERLSNLAVCAKKSPPSNKCKKSSKISWNCTSTDEEEGGLGCESALIKESFAEVMQSIDEFVDDCDNLANEFDTIALRMSEGGESDDEYF